MIIWLNENILNYNFSLGVQYNFSVLVGFIMQEIDQDFVDIIGENFVNDNFGVIVLVVDIINGFIQGIFWGLIFYLVCVNYNFDNKYYLMVLICIDGFF